MGILLSLGRHKDFGDNQKKIEGISEYNACHHEDIVDNSRKIQGIEEFNACLSALPSRPLRSHYQLHTLVLHGLHRSLCIRHEVGLDASRSARAKAAFAQRQRLTESSETLFQSICEFPTIEVLNLSEFFMNSVPSSICRLYNLKKLILRENRLLSLPHSLRLCQKLETIDIRDNIFTRLDYCLTLLPKLSQVLVPVGNLHSRAVELAQQPKLSDRFKDAINFSVHGCYEVLSLFQLAVPPSLATKYGKLDAFTVLPSAEFVADVERAMTLFHICDVCFKSCPRKCGLTFYSIQLLCMHFAGNSLVPLAANVCSYECGVVANAKYHDVPTGFVVPKSWDRERDSWHRD